MPHPPISLKMHFKKNNKKAAEACHATAIRLPFDEMICSSTQNPIKNGYYIRIYVYIPKFPKAILKIAFPTKTISRYTLMVFRHQLESRPFTPSNPHSSEFLHLFVANVAHSCSALVLASKSCWNIKR